MDISKFFPIRLQAIVADRPLPCDLYVVINGTPTAFRKRNDVIKHDRLQELANRGVRTLYGPEDQRDLYTNSLHTTLKDPGTSVEAKSRVLKESASIQMQELFQNPDLPKAIGDTRILVENMVTFVSGNMAAVQSLMALSMSDRFTFNHSINVSVYAVVLAKTLYPNEQGLMAAAGLAGLLHDIGKRDLGPDLLDKTDQYSVKDVMKMREHPTVGEAMLKPFVIVSPDVKTAVAQHHEHYDGTGYPKALSGNQVSKLSRLIAIADVFDALTVDRAGEPGLSATEAIESMGAMDGRFDPHMFQALRSKKTITTPRKLQDGFDACVPQPLKFKA